MREPALRAKRVHPRFSEEEFVLLARAAGLSRMPVGGYVAETSLAAARSDDPTAAVADYRTAVKALMATNGQLAKIGNNLNQLTRHLNQDAPWPAPDLVRELLRHVEASIADVDTAVAQVTCGR
ncbi:mobilization protein [Streptomyces sp. MBRL 601]|nr:mobilization protein [Streptomyces sp. MBRL 601]